MLITSSITVVTQLILQRNAYYTYRKCMHYVCSLSQSYSEEPRLKCWSSPRQQFASFSYFTSKEICVLLFLESQLKNIQPILICPFCDFKLCLSPTYIRTHADTNYHTTYTHTRALPTSRKLGFGIDKGLTRSGILTWASYRSRSGLLHGPPPTEPGL